MKKVTGFLVAASLVMSTQMAFAGQRDAMIGGALGGVIGSVIGSQIGGRDGAVIGAGIGAMAGVAVTANDGRRYESYERPHGEYEHCRDDGRGYRVDYRPSYRGYDQDRGHGYSVGRGEYVDRDDYAHRGWHGGYRERY